jgi:hypothetical protein
MKRALLLLLLVACDDTSLGTETVSLSWSFAGLGCDDSGVRTVHVFIGPLAPSGFYDQELRCEAGEGKAVALRGVAPGRHTLVLKGLARDKVIYTLTEEIEVGTPEMGRFDLVPYAPP